MAGTACGSVWLCGPGCKNGNVQDNVPRLALVYLYVMLLNDRPLPERVYICICNENSFESAFAYIFIDDRV